MPYAAELIDCLESFSRRMWLSPSCQWHAAGQMHGVWALQNIKGLKGDPSDAAIAAMEDGWVRVVVEGDILYAECISISSAQRREINDYAIEHDLDPILHNAVLGHGVSIGEDFNSDFEELPKGNLPREELPQIKGDVVPQFLDYLKKHQVSVRYEKTDAKKLQPTQAEFSRDKVKCMLDEPPEGKPLLVSADDYVLDGHHRWAAAYLAGDSVDICRLGKRIKELIPLASDFDKATFKEVDESYRITFRNIDQYRGNVDVSSLKNVGMWDIFNHVENAQIVPISQIVSTKNELEDARFVRGEKADPRATATKFMALAAKGEAAKRDPLTVQKQGNEYVVLDGNATVQSLLLAGWSKVPVVVV